MSVVDYSPEEVKQKLDDGTALLVDVREPNEFLHERIPGAFLFPLSSFDPAQLPADGSKELILHCGIGQRSQMAGMAALEGGVPKVAHLAPGIKGWKMAGLATIVTDPVTGQPMLKEN